MDSGKHDIVPRYQYERAGDLNFKSRHGQASKVDLVRRIGESDSLLVRKIYTFGGWDMTPSKAHKDLLSEYEILRSLDHPNIVALEDCEYRPQTSRWDAYLYMEYCRGGDLSKYANNGSRQNRSLSLAQYNAVSTQLVSALLYCHTGIRIEDEGLRLDPEWRDPVLHRDIKPENGTLAETLRMQQNA